MTWGKAFDKLRQHVPRPCGRRAFGRMEEQRGGWWVEWSRGERRCQRGANGQIEFNSWIIELLIFTFSSPESQV